MRTKNSIKNTIWAFLSNFITILIGLIAQTVFVHILGKEYLGLNGLFTNIISMLGIVELGVGSAIIYNLYRPIAEKNIEKIKSLMTLYKKSYHIIALIVSLLALLLLPFLKFLITDITVPVNIYFVYLLFMIDIIFSYLLTYKRSILYANQKNYLVTIIHIIYLIVMNGLQIGVLIVTKNYYLYLGIKVIMRLVENVAITITANRMYPYLSEKNIEPLDQNTKRDIVKKIKALFFHKIGGFVVNGTDNMIISKYLGIAEVGLYSSYYLLLNSIQTLFGQVISSITSSIGNLLATSDEQKCFDVFKKIRFMNFIIATFTGTAILIVIQSFVTIWLGKDYLLPVSVVMVLVVQHYQSMMRNCYSSFKEAAGIFYEDRFIPILEAAINIVASILLVHIFGLAGVFMGTIISSLVLHCYSYPKYVYKRLFGQKYSNYVKETFGYLVLFLSIAVSSYFITTKIRVANIYLQFGSNLIIAAVFPTVLLVLLFYRTEEFQYFKQMLFKLLRKEGQNEKK